MLVKINNNKRKNKKVLKFYNKLKIQMVNMLKLLMILKKK